jgi:hypothetical protein
MRAVALGLALLALAGCKSGRDYTSANNEGLRFLFETFREGNRIRKKNLKQDLAFSKRAPENRRVRKESAAFAWQSIWREEWTGLSEIKRDIKAERVPWSERLAQMRFGLLDSGD